MAANRLPRRQRRIRPARPPRRKTPRRRIRRRWQAPWRRRPRRSLPHRRRLLRGWPRQPPPRPSPPPPADGPPAAPKPVGNAVVRFLPPQVEINAQGTTTVALIIENATDVSSAPLQVSFDPKVVKLNDAGRGDFFSSDGQIPVFTKNIQNDAGAAAMNLSRLPDTPGVSGTGVLTTLVFQAVAKGSTTVTIPNLTVRNTQGQVVFSGSPRLTISVK